MHEKGGQRKKERAGRGTDRVAEYLHSSKDNVLSLSSSWLNIQRRYRKSDVKINSFLNKKRMF